jgi:hypothetical protein
VSINSKRRGETLDLTEFATLADHLHAMHVVPPPREPGKEKDVSDDQG